MQLLRLSAATESKGDGVDPVMPSTRAVLRLDIFVTARLRGVTKQNLLFLSEI